MVGAGEARSIAGECCSNGTYACHAVMCLVSCVLYDPIGDVASIRFVVHIVVFSFRIFTHLFLHVVCDVSCVMFDTMSVKCCVLCLVFGVCCCLWCSILRVSRFLHHFIFARMHTPTRHTILVPFSL